MENRSTPEHKESINTIDFKIVEKSDTVKEEVMKLLHEYPDRFIHGLFEQYAEDEYRDSNVVVAYHGSEAVGCLMFNPLTHEFSWLAVKKDIPFSKAEIAKRLFEVFYPAIEPGMSVHLFVNTEDAHVSGTPKFSGANFESARRLYRSMGLQVINEHRVKDKFGKGAHAYRVAWVPNKKEA